MSSTTGTYEICDDQGFTISIACTGPTCGNLTNQFNLTCTQPDSNSWNCNNGYQCSGSAIFSSNFVIDQSDTLVSQTQNFTIGGSTFIMQQDGTGNATLFNSTASITSTPATPSTSLLLAGSSSRAASSSTAAISSTAASSTKQASGSAKTNPSTTQTGTGTIPVASASQSSRSQSSHAGNPPSYAVIILLLFLAIFVVGGQAQQPFSGFQIGQTFISIWNDLGPFKNVIGLVQAAVAKGMDGFISEVCGTLVSGGVKTSIGLVAESFAQCEEEVLGLEMSRVGSPLALVLRSYAGIGGILVTGITAADEAAVLAADAAAIPYLFLFNSVACASIIAAAEYQLQHSATGLCEAVEAAASNIANRQPAPTPTPTPTTTPTPTPTPQAGSPMAIPDVSDDPCAKCEVSLYMLGVQGLAQQCHVAIPLADTYDLAVNLCDSTLDGRYSAFWAYACANQCVTYNVNDWIQNAGASFLPSASLALCAQDCPGFKGDGRCQSGDFCPCGQGSFTCKAC